ncbi:MAG: hypothetical protein AAF962_10895 [Actinomycetota bacterium]
MGDDAHTGDGFEQLMRQRRLAFVAAVNEARDAGTTATQLARIAEMPGQLPEWVEAVLTVQPNGGGIGEVRRRRERHRAPFAERGGEAMERFAETLHELTRWVVDDELDAVLTTTSAWSERLISGDDEAVRQEAQRALSVLNRFHTALSLGRPVSLRTD